MAQVLKSEVRDRIVEAGLRQFARHGYRDASLTAIARDAGTAVGNVYRYFADKSTLLAAAVPDPLVARHDRLLTARLDALVHEGPSHERAADELLEFWIEHRLAVVVLLGRAQGTPFADAPSRFVDRLVRTARRAHPEIDPVATRLLEVVFDNTRAAIVAILAGSDDPDEIRRLIHGFWSYQLPGLAGLDAWIEHDGRRPTAPPSRTSRRRT
ncbi:MAG: helix-turn-helix domain-containing protein [Acidimicrobiales bacterium]